VVGQGSDQTRGSARVCMKGTTVACFLVSALISLSPQTAPVKHKAPSPANRPEIVFVQTPELASGPLARRFPRGSGIVRLSDPDAPRNLMHLTDDFFAAADPQISFDDTKILFSGKKSQGERWQIWEMDLKGANKRQITSCSEDCLRAAYLPADRLAFTVEEAKGRQLNSYLAVTKTDGSDFHRISFGNAPFQLETVLGDGRIVASAPWPLLAAADTSGSRLLYTLRPDGTALESLRCEHHGTTIQADAAELGDGSLLFVQELPGGKHAGGELVRIEQGTLSGTLLGVRKFVYQSARQLSEEELIVSKKAATAADSAGRFDLYILDLKTGEIGGRLFGDSQLSSVQPVPVVPRPAPKHYWNTLNPDSRTGNFIALNSYLSADDPLGRISTPISRVRVFTLNSTDGKERNLGEAPVEVDGSFFVKVPANWPIRFVLLDKKGQIIREEHGWIWTRPGEQRGCAGCHGDKAIAPDNHWPLTLRRFDTPTPLGEIDHGPTTTQAN